MSIFVEVKSIAPKPCPLIINMDYVLEIAPLVAGGCVITMGAQEAGSSRTITVSDDYSMFKQFVMQTVTPEQIKQRFPKVSKRGDANIEPQGDSGVEFNIPSFGAKGAE